MDSEIENEAVRLRESGVRLVDICSRLDITKMGLYWILKRREVKMRPLVQIPFERYHEVMTALRTGSTQVEVAKKFGCHKNTIINIQSRMGGIPPRAPSLEARKRLDLDDRFEIAIGIRQESTNAEIARRIGFHRSTVGKEIERNGGRCHYKPAEAQQRAQESCRRPKEFKLVELQDVRELIEDKLDVDKEDYWSPRQIADRIRKEFPDERHKWVSHETVYRSLYIQSRSTLRADLKRCLRTGRTKRKSRTDVVGKGKILDMINIAERPPEVDDRRVPGNWEGDLIVGENNASAIATLVERTTRFVMLAKIDNKTTEVVTAAIGAKILELPEQLRKTLTWDQGREMAAHKKFSVDTNIDVYFCDPHSPWQRGTNENTNGLLRQYFPKGTDLSVHSQERLDYVAAKLNTRPRETLDFRTPADMLARLIDQPN